MSQVSVFVSHSHQDNEWCRPMVAALKAVGYDVWYDETGLTGGVAWVETIQREVQARDVFLLVLTPEAWASQWVQDELQLAIATRRRILPILLRNTPVDGFILTTQWVTVIGEEPPVAARAIILAIETPPAPGRGATPQAQETLDDLVTLCQSLLAEGRYTEALSACDRALALDPDNVDVLRAQGAALNKIGQRTRAAAVFARILFRLSPTHVDMNQVADYSQFVIHHSDNASDLLQAYYRWYDPIDSSQYSMGHLVSVAEAAVHRLAGRGVKIEAIVDFLFWLISRYKGSYGNEDDQASKDTFTALAHLGQTDTLLQLSARLGKEIAGIVAMARIGSIDAVMQQAAQVQRIGDRKDILAALASRAHLDRDGRSGYSYTVIDHFCRDWFGYPPPNPTSQDAYQASLLIWSQALEQLGQRKEADTVKKIAERRGWLW